jgi:hypothetical protein
MRFAFPTAALVLLLGSTAPSHAQRGQGGRPQRARPAQQQARPAQQQPRQARPAAREQTQQARPAQQQHIQQAGHSLQQQAHPAKRVQQVNPGPNQVRAQQPPPTGRVRGGNEHGRISNDHYATHFGSRHSFHVNRGDYDHRRFWYGGYQFGFIDPWPIGWGYSDDVYVEYTDGGYYMYNRFRPGVRISINIL